MSSMLDDEEEDDTSYFDDFEEFSDSIAMESARFRILRSIDSDVSLESTFYESFDLEKIQFPNKLSVTSQRSIENFSKLHKFKIRKYLLKSILERETNFLSILEILVEYKELFEAAVKDGDPLINTEEINRVFYAISEIHKTISDFVSALNTKLYSWKDTNTAGDIFKPLLNSFDMFKDYKLNYHKSMATIQKCSSENPEFRELTRRKITSGSTGETCTVVDILHVPIKWPEQTAFTIKDLLKYTPVDHDDYKILMACWIYCHKFLRLKPSSAAAPSVIRKDYDFPKTGYFVEQIDESRKLRFMLLYPDAIVCAKQKISRNEVCYRCKWFIPLVDVKIADKSDHFDSKILLLSDEIIKAKKKIFILKALLNAEVKKLKYGKKKFLIVAFRKREIRNLKLKLATQVVLDTVMEEISYKTSSFSSMDLREILLALAFPYLDLTLVCGIKTHTLLTGSEIIIEEWKDAIENVKLAAAKEATNVTRSIIQERLNSYKRIPQITGLKPGAKFQFTFTGILDVLLHEVRGLYTACDTFVTLEVDSHGGFFMNPTQSKICYNSTIPSWNEKFELPLECSKLLRIMLYKKDVIDEKAILLGRTAYDLNSEAIHDDYRLVTVCLQPDEKLTLVLSIRHVANKVTEGRRYTLCKTNSMSKLLRMKGEVFGVELSKVLMREERDIPLIVISCVEEVEKRGLKQIGIYRVSGLVETILELKNAFNKCSPTAAKMIADTNYSIHVVAGLLKLYFIELPEPLISYANQFAASMAREDDFKRGTVICSLIQSLPDPNYNTLIYMIDHIIRVSNYQKVNKMNLHHLARVFGKILMQKTSTLAFAPTASELSLADPVQYSTIFEFILNLRIKGVEITRPDCNI